MAKLELKKEVMDAQAEVGRCILESQYSDVDDDELDQRSRLSLKVETQTLNQKIEKFFSSESRQKEDETITNRDPLVDVGLVEDVEVKRHLTGEVKRIRQENKTQSRGHSVDREKLELKGILERQTTLMERQQATVEKFSTGIELPKREFLYFDGNPVNYTKFIRNFETNIENRVTDSGIRLSYLIQYTLGAAREAIENCVILPADEGYVKAKDILRKNFGQKHKILRGLIDKVTKGAQIKAGESEKLMQLARDMRNCLLNSTQLKYRSDVNAMDTLSKIVKKLPSYLQAKWAERSGSLIEHEIEPEFEHLTEFIEKSAAISNTIFGKLVGAKLDDDSKDKVKPRIPNKATSFATKATGTEENNADEATGFRNNNSIPTKRETKCVYCNQTNHELERCYKFREKSYMERMEFVRKEKLCDNCLKRNHVARRCRFGPSCMMSGCAEKHHSLLHQSCILPNESPNDSTNKKGKESPQQRNEAGNTGSCSAAINSRQKVCLRIIPVKVSNEDRTREIETYAFIDNGSDTTLCTRDLVDELHLSNKPCEFTLTTINGQDKLRRGKEVKLNIHNLNGDGDIYVDRVWTVEKLPISEKYIPTKEEINRWPHLHDIEFPKLENGKVTILIGSDVPEAHWIFEERRGKPREPLAVRTLLGWTLLGPVGNAYQREASVNFIQTDQETITSQIQRLYNAEFTETSSSDTVMSVEDRRAFAVMENTVCKVDDHYQIGLPWRYQTPCLPDNRPMAERRLRLLQNRLKKDESLRIKYKNMIDDYIHSGHARKVPSNEAQEASFKDRPVWYLPHHGVFKSGSDKLRVVFDCSARYKGTSLNDQLLSGPDLTNSLVGVLIRFRQEPIALMSDIKQMFHQVKVDPKDIDAFLFLWWPDGDLSNQPQDFQMLVHLFGATSSPSCASYALKKTAIDN